MVEEKPMENGINIFKINEHRQEFSNKNSKKRLEINLSGLLRCSNTGLPCMSFKTEFYIFKASGRKVRQEQS
jgi:hypothetical protein